MLEPGSQLTTNNVGSSAPRLKHYDAGLAILAYLHGAKDIGLKYYLLRFLHSRSTATHRGGVSRTTTQALPSCSAAPRYLAISACSKRIKLKPQSFNGYALRLATRCLSDNQGLVLFSTGRHSHSSHSPFDKFLLYGRDLLLL